MLPDSTPSANALRKRRWRAANPEKERQQRRRAFERNPEKVREHYRKWAAAHPDYRRVSGSRLRESEQKRRKNAWYQANLRTLKLTQGCSDCGTRDERKVIQYHHLDPSTKKHDISAMYGCSTRVWLDEIAKCTVLCRSCHKKRHDVVDRERKAASKRIDLFRACGTMAKFRQGCRCRICRSANNEVQRRYYAIWQLAHGD